MGIRGNVRRDSKHRILRAGESIRADGKYQFKYYVNGKAKFVYSWRLEPTDKLPSGKQPCASLRELEKQIGYGKRPSGIEQNKRRSNLNMKTIPLIIGML